MARLEDMIFSFNEDGSNFDPYGGGANLGGGGYGGIEGSEPMGRGIYTPPPPNYQDILYNQIMGQNLTGKWTGQGFGSPDANAKDMAKILSGIGITDIKQFGKIPKYAPAQEAYKIYNGRLVQETFDGETGVRRRYTVEPDFDEEGYFTTRMVDVPKDAKLQTMYTVDVGPDEYKEVDASKIKTVDGKLVLHLMLILVINILVL